MDKFKVIVGFFGFGRVIDQDHLELWIFQRQEDYFAHSVAACWLGTSLFNMATYIGDARAQVLPLVSPFGGEDILINNIAWVLRRFPFFALPGDGSYRLQPVYVDDLAALAVEAAGAEQNLIWDAVGPEDFTFRQMVDLIGWIIGHPRPLIAAPPRLALAAAQMISLFVGDVVLTAEEVDGLMQNLLVSSQPPRCTTRLSDWLLQHKDQVGRRYASEIKRHY